MILEGKVKEKTRRAKPTKRDGFYKANLVIYHILLVARINYDGVTGA